MAGVLEAMDREGRVPNSDDVQWEDRIIAARREMLAGIKA
jgi:hypothetical protein